MYDIMKVAIILIGLLVTFATAEEEKKMSSYVAAINQGVRECVESMNLSNETVQFIVDGKGHDNKDVQCFKACVMEKAGIRNGLSVDAEKIESLIRSSENLDEKKVKFAIEQSETCKAEAEVSDDECEVMGHYMDCFKEKLRHYKADP